jgi:DNA-binding SARP family transcriptional activator
VGLTSVLLGGSDEFVIRVAPNHAPAVAVDDPRHGSLLLGYVRHYEAAFGEPLEGIWRLSGTVRVRLLGRVGIEHGQRWLDGSALPGRQGRIVLAHLALCHDPVSRADLADLVWPDALTTSWERDLSAVVSKIRTALDSIELGSLLHGAFGCYELQLPPESRIDVDDAVRFVEDAESAWRARNRDVAVPAAATAANLARRPLLPGERGLWVERRRDDLRATLLRALDVLAQGLAEGPYEHDALRYAKEAVALDPYRETSYVQLMRLHARQGNRADALRTYEQCRAILADDLGVNPSSQTEAAYREVLGP